MGARKDQRHKTGRHLWTSVYKRICGNSTLKTMKGQITTHKPVHSWQSDLAGGEFCNVCQVQRRKVFLTKFWTYFRLGVALPNKPECITRKIQADGASETR
jgi:hypothetical protein